MEITSDNEKNVYTLEVYREKVESVMKYQEVTLGSGDKVMNENTPYIISFVCFLVILLFFIVIFVRKKSK